MNKLGAGFTTLTAPNNYTGATAVSQGTLIVAGSISGTSGVTVGGGALLGELERRFQWRARIVRHTVAESGRGKQWHAERQWHDLRRD